MQSPMPHPSQSLADWLAAEPFTLVMSSGFFGFFAHCGVLWALESCGLRPQRVRGASAGALVTGLWASGLSAETIASELLALVRTDFWDPRLGPGLLAGRLFDRKLRALLPVSDFSSCRVEAHVSTFDVLARRTRVLQHGDIATAIRASCAVPIMFHPVWHEGRPLLDGGIADRPGLATAFAGERILYHHLVTNSPWRRPDARAVQVPVRDNLRAWIVPDMPKVTPFHLQRGREALERARSYTLAALATGHAARA